MFFIVFLILGIVFLAISSTYVKYINSYCDGSLDTSNWNDNQKQLLDDIREIERDLANVPSQWMCTVTCPCPASNATTGNWYTSKYLSNTTLESYAR